MRSVDCARANARHRASVPRKRARRVSAGEAREPDPQVGLCAACRFAQRQANPRGSVFWRCRRAETDARFRRYPPLPVRECAGFDAGPDPDADGTTPAWTPE